MVTPVNITDVKKIYRTAKLGEFPEELSIPLQKLDDLRYGENPNQLAASYQLKGSTIAELVNVRMAKSGKGGMSATNLMDVTRAIDILKFYSDPAVAVMKHCIPSGFAVQYPNRDLSTTYAMARDADRRSALGSFVVANCELDKATAETIMSTYVEGVVAPSFAEGVMDILERKKDLRVCTFNNIDKIPKFVGDDDSGIYDIKMLPTGLAVVQKPYLTSIRGPENLILRPLVRTEDEEASLNRAPTGNEFKDLLMTWYVNLGTRSNGIVFGKDGVTVVVGSGQQERVGAVEQAMIKAYQKAMDREGIPYYPINGAVGRELLKNDPIKGSVMSSDAYFPFEDSIILLGRHGCTAVIQPYGSISDVKVIKKLNEYNMAGPATLERCFGHF